MPLAGLATGHKVGLLVMAGIFIVFALGSAFLAPRRSPDFPGRGARVYYLATLVLFVLMVAAVEVFGAESSQKKAGAEATSAQPRGTIEVSEREWAVQLPSSKPLQAGTYVFHVRNAGKTGHNLTIDGPHVSGAHTPTIAPGQSADLRVTLETGTYDVYCSIPGHKAAGMDAKLAVS